VSRFCRSLRRRTLPVDAPTPGSFNGSTTRTRASGSSSVSLLIVTTKSTSSSSRCVTARWSASRFPRFSRKNATVDPRLGGELEQPAAIFSFAYAGNPSSGGRRARSPGRR
jgi:hypothetical protein